MNSLSTEVVKLDLDEILANYNLPEYWQKNWLIYKSDFISIFARISLIDVKKGIIEMEVCQGNEYYDCKELGKTIYCYQKEKTISIPFNNPEYTKEKFLRDVLFYSLDVLKNVEMTIIMKLYEYRKAYELKNKENQIVDDVVNEVVEDYISEKGICNEDIIENLCDSVSYKIKEKIKIKDRSFEVYKNHKYTVLPNEYLMLAQYLGGNAAYQNMLEETNKERISIIDELEEHERYIETDEFEEKIKEQVRGLL